jgi:DNA-binding TFAR19-related protein (PDSD5 family)
MLARAIPLQGLQSITRRHAEILQARSDLELSKLASGYGRDAGEPRDAVPLRKSLRVEALERLDHARIVTRRVIIVKFGSICRNRSRAR